MRSTRSRDHPPAASPSAQLKLSPTSGSDALLPAAGVLDAPHESTGQETPKTPAGARSKRSGKPRGDEEGCTNGNARAGGTAYGSGGGSNGGLAIVTTQNPSGLRADLLPLGSNAPVALPHRRLSETRATGWMVRHPRHRTFGYGNPRVPDSTVTTVFSYMTNDELYNTSLVCTAWAALAMDADVWNWEGVECANVPLTPAFEYLAFKGTPVGSRHMMDGSMGSPFGSPLMHPSLSLESPLRLLDSASAPKGKAAATHASSKAVGTAATTSTAIVDVAEDGVRVATRRHRK
jgi:hypothetical protein